MIGDLIAGQDSYEHLNREIKNTMRRSASDAVRLGYLLRKCMTGSCGWQGTTALTKYLQRELHMDYSMATRFVNINKNILSAETARRLPTTGQGSRSPC